MFIRRCFCPGTSFCQMHFCEVGRVHGPSFAADSCEAHAIIALYAGFFPSCRTFLSVSSPFSASSVSCMFFFFFTASHHLTPLLGVGCGASTLLSSVPLRNWALSMLWWLLWRGGLLLAWGVGREAFYSFLPLRMRTRLRLRFLAFLFFWKSSFVFGL